MKKFMKITSSASADTSEITTSEKVAERLKEVEADFQYYTDGLQKLARDSEDFAQVSLDYLNKFDSDLQRAIELVAEALTD